MKHLGWYQNGGGNMRESEIFITYVQDYWEKKYILNSFMQQTIIFGGK